MKVNFIIGLLIVVQIALTFALLHTLTNPRECEVTVEKEQTYSEHDWEAVLNDIEARQ